MFLDAVQLTNLRAIITSLYPLLIVALAASSAAAKGIVDATPNRLEDILFVKQESLDPLVEKTAIAVSRYCLSIENREEPNLDVSAVIPDKQNNCGYSMFVFEGFPNYRFVNEFVCGDLNHIVAVYKPDIKNPSSPNHLVFDAVLENKIETPKSWSQQMDDRFLQSLCTLIDNNNALNSYENVDKAATVLIYIYYWHLLSGRSMYLFGERPEGIYTCTDPSSLAHTAFGDALNLQWLWPNKRNDSSFNVYFVLPEGRKTFFPRGEEQKLYQLTFYTWDAVSRKILLWTFTGWDYIDGNPRSATDNPMYINEIVIGSF